MASVSGGFGGLRSTASWFVSLRVPMCYRDPVSSVPIPLGGLMTISSVHSPLPSPVSYTYTHTHTKCGLAQILLSAEMTDHHGEEIHATVYSPSPGLPGSIRPQEVRLPSLRVSRFRWEWVLLDIISLWSYLSNRPTKNGSVGADQKGSYGDGFKVKRQPSFQTGRGRPARFHRYLRSTI